VDGIFVLILHAIKMFRNILIVFILNFLFLSGSNADESFPFNYDYSVFRDDSSKLFIEFYYSFDPHQMVFLKTASGYEANGRIEMQLIRKSDSRMVASKDFRIPMVLKDTSGSGKDIKLTGQINMILDSGVYMLKLKASDLNDSTRFSNSEELIELKGFPLNKAVISSIQLSTAILKSSDDNSIFYKNTLDITPNPSALFGNNLYKLYYYAELYNLNADELGEKYFVKAAITDNTAKELASTINSFMLKTESKVEYGSFDISKLPSNKYNLILQILDSKQNELARAEKFFYVYNSSVNLPQEDLTDFEQDYLLSEYPAMKDEQVQNEYEKAIYLMSDIQKKQYGSLKIPDARKMYMFKFWKGIESILNKKTYFERIEYANKNFKSDFRDGWKTDRGRIYSIYGKYDEIERFPYEGSTRAYEIWTYNVLQGGVQFVFVDMSAGYGDYVMVHSTAQNELRDENWREKLSIR
jgi:GWxTD domain-containing protein